MKKLTRLKRKFVSGISFIVYVFIICILNVGFAQDDGLDEDTTEENSFNAKVSLPWNDFRQLLNRMKQDTVQKETVQNLPAQYVISDADFTGKPDNEQECSFSVRLTVTVLDPKAYIEIPLGRGLSMYPGITVNNRAGSTGVNQDGTTYIFLHGKGKYEIAYRFSVPVSYTSGKYTATFPLPGQAASHIAMDLGSNAFSVWANERPLSLAQGGMNRIMYEGGLGNCTDAIVTWQQTVNSQGKKDALISSTLNTIYSVASDVIKINSQINFSIVHNSIHQFSFSVPSSVDIIDVTGNAIATWETVDSSDTRLVTAFLKYDVKDNVNFLVHAEMNCPDSTTIVHLPAITVLNVIRQEGIIGVGVLSSIEINPHDHSNNVLMRDKRELPEWFSDQGDVIHVYQYLSDNYRIALELVRHTNIPVLNALITSAEVKSMIREDGKMVTTIDLNVRNRGEQFLRVKWKKDYQLWSVYSNDEPSRPSMDTLSNELLVPLQRTSDKTVETSIRIIYLSKQNPLKNVGSLKIVYPEINMPVQSLTGGLFLPENIKPITIKGALNNDVSTKKKIWITSNFINGKYNGGSGSDNLYRNKSFSSEVKFDQNQFGGRSPRTRSSVVSVNKKMSENIDDLLNSMTQQRDYETGILSIPVQIDFEGFCLPYSSIMFQKNDSMDIKFLYYQLLPSTVTIMNVVVFLLMLFAACMVTYIVYSKVYLRYIMFTILITAVISFVLKWLCDQPLNIDLLFIVPAIFLCYVIIIKVISRLKKPVANSDEGDSLLLPTSLDREIFRKAFSTGPDSEQGNSQDD